MLLLPVNAISKTPDWLDTIDKLERLYSKEPNNEKLLKQLTVAYNNYAFELSANKDFVNAERYMDMALKLRSDDTALKNNASTIYVKHGFDIFNSKQQQQSYSITQFDDAKRLAEKAISLNPKSVNAYILLGKIEHINNKHSSAIKALTTASQLRPDNQDIKKLLEQFKKEQLNEQTMHSEFNRYFIIKVDEDLKAATTYFDISSVLDDVRQDVSRDLRFIQKSKITVLLYDYETYKNTLDFVPHWAGGLYDGKIRVPISREQKYFGQIESTIVHEYTHAVIANLSQGKCPKWLNEGIARYEEYKHGIRPRINKILIAHTRNQLIPWSEFNDAFRSSDVNLVNLAYQQAYSVLRYMTERYPASKLHDLLTEIATTDDLNQALLNTYQIDLDTLEKNWELWLVNFFGQ